MTTFVDTNILIYLTREGDNFHQRAVDAFNERRALGPIIVCDVVYAELAVAFDSKEAVDEILRELALVRTSMNDDVLYEASRIFRSYKQRAGTRSKPLPDHFIGAQAKVARAPLLTNNIADFSHIEELQVVGI